MLWYHDSLIEAQSRLFPTAMMTYCDRKQLKLGLRLMRHVGVLLKAL